MSVRIFCPNCGTEMEVSEGAFGTPLTTERDGMFYLIPKEIHNCNLSRDAGTAEARVEALKAMGVNVDRLREIMRSNTSVKDIFADDDPIVEKISSRGFIDNPELFRRWICAQTWGLIKGNRGWTEVVRRRYDIKYVFAQTKRELVTLIKLINKNVSSNDPRWQFFTLTDLNRIFAELMDHNIHFSYRADVERKNTMKDRLLSSRTYSELLGTVANIHWRFDNYDKFKPKTWLNCFKGAGAYYTLQNLIQSHGLIIPTCTDEDSSLEYVDTIYKSIIGYEPSQRRWDILMSTLVKAVKETNFELTF